MKRTVIRLGSRQCFSRCAFVVFLLLLLMCTTACNRDDLTRQEPVTPSTVGTDSNLRFGEGFGGTRWGMSRQQVKGILGKSYRLESDVGNYKGEIHGMECKLTTHFYRDSLYDIGVVFSGSFVSLKNVSGKYEELRSILTELYGKPMPMEEWDFAPGFGSIWQTKETEIRLALHLHQEQTLLFALGFACRQLASKSERDHAVAIKRRKNRTLSRTHSQLNIISKPGPDSAAK